jgi:ABC-2 type transport system ATP-binding protein
MAAIEASGLTKRYGRTVALDRVDLTVDSGRIVGLIGPNGAGKTSLLKAVLGLTAFEGRLSVLGHDPFRERARLMQEVCFIADVATLPRWLRVCQAVDFVAGVHRRFDRGRALDLLARTEIPPRARIKALSKGMIAQLHLALVMAIDARLLVLDEPTLGLDILFRRTFYTTLLNDYFDQHRTIIVTTHQVDEIEHVLTDLVFINHGRIVLEERMEALAERYLQVVVPAERAEAARRLGPLAEQQLFGRFAFLFEGLSRDDAAALGEVRTPRIGDLFAAKMGAASA